MRKEERYARQLLLPEIGAAGQERLSRAHVLLVGVGGLGCPIAQYLVGAGIGRLTLVDDDVVSVSNLHRQILYDESQVGEPKALMAQRRLSLLNSEVKIEAHVCRLTPENAESLAAGCDVLIDGCDNFATRFLLDDVSERMGIPYFYGAVRGFEGQAAVFGLGETPLRYRDLHPDREATLKMPHPGKQVVGMTPAVVGSVLATQVVQYVCGHNPSLTGRLWTINLLTMESAAFEW